MTTLQQWNIQSDKIGELELLHKLFGTIITTNEVAKEYGNSLPEWIELKEPHHKNYQTIIEASIDKGEASAIALAIEFEDCLLIIDDLKGRRFATGIGLKITGTLGVIIEAKLAGYILSIKPILNKIKATNFRLTEAIENTILLKCGE